MYSLKKAKKIFKLFNKEQKENAYLLACQVLEDLMNEKGSKLFADSVNEILKDESESFGLKIKLFILEVLEISFDCNGYCGHIDLEQSCGGDWEIGDYNEKLEVAKAFNFYTLMSNLSR